MKRLLIRALPLVPALLLLLSAGLFSEESVRWALLLAGGFALVVSVVGVSVLHLVAEYGVQYVLAGMVAGMLMRLLALSAFCLVMTRFEAVHLLVACLSASGAVISSLLIDSVQVAQRLSALTTTASGHGATPVTNSETAGV